MRTERITLDHGGGGRASRQLISELFLTYLGNQALNALEDAADFKNEPGRLAMTTDAYVVSPIFFPGGDIGSLAVHGTINDLAMRGARPLALSAAFILEEGLPLADLEQVAASMAKAAKEAGVAVVAGDTKVVGRQAADKIFITTAGVGCIPPGRHISVHLARPGDQVILSGSLGEHGVAILASRAGLKLQTPVISDSAALSGLVEVLAQALGDRLHCLRDPTRGGLASVANEIAQASGVGLELEEEAILVKPAVAAACEILGLDPLYLANEGKLVAIVAAEAAREALAVLRSHPLGQEAARIGQVVADHPGRVALRTRIGGQRLVDLLWGEQLPRIC